MQNTSNYEMCAWVVIHVPKLKICTTKRIIKTCKMSSTTCYPEKFKNTTEPLMLFSPKMHWSSLKYSFTETAHLWSTSSKHPSGVLSMPCVTLSRRSFNGTHCTVLWWSSAQNFTATRWRYYGHVFEPVGRGVGEWGRRRGGGKGWEQDLHTPCA